MEKFETEYLRLYGHTNPGNPIITGQVHLSATGLVSKPGRSDADTDPAASTPAISEHRTVWSMQAQDMIKTPVYEGKSLHPGQQIDGPAIINESTTTIVIDQADQLTMPDRENYLVHVGAANG